jgi:hypothetical protein
MRLAFFERLRTRGYDRVLLQNLSPAVSHSQRFSLLFGQAQDEEVYLPGINLELEPEANPTVDDEDFNKSFDLVFKIRGCFQFMKKDLYNILFKEWEHMLIKSNTPYHRHFFMSFTPKIICIQEPNLSQKVICTKVT